MTIFLVAVLVVVVFLSFAGPNSGIGSRHRG
jgi:hypothetical protein